MRKNKNPILLLGFLILSFSLLLSSAWAETSTPLPTFNIPTLSKGKRLTNKTFIGKVSLLNVWGSWCKYCQLEHKMLLNIKNAGIPIYGLAYKDSAEAAQDWLNRAGNPYVLVGLDESGTVGSDLGVTGTPKTYIIDKHGRIRYEYSGGIDQDSWSNELLPLVKKYQKEA